MISSEDRRAIQQLLNELRVIDGVVQGGRAITYEHGIRIVKLVEEHAGLLVRALEAYR